jgi:hypothetical protein
MGLPIPKYCVKHKEKPCLLQVRESQWSLSLILIMIIARCVDPLRGVLDPDLGGLPS